MPCVSYFVILMHEKFWHKIDKILGLLSLKAAGKCLPLFVFLIVFVVFHYILSIRFVSFFFN